MPAIVGATGMLAMIVIAGNRLSLLVVLTGSMFIVAAALINLVPYLGLFRLHDLRVHKKTGLKNYSLYTSFIAGIVVQILFILLLLRDVYYGIPGSQFTTIGILFLPSVVIPVMLVSYIIAWLVEWLWRKRVPTYAVEDAETAKAIKEHFVKFRKMYLFLAALIVLSTTLSFTFSYLNEVVRIRNINNADVNKKDPENGQTELHHAASHGKKKAVELLLAKGADIHIRDNLGNTPLHSAAQAGETHVIAYLLEHGADPNAQNTHGDTPLHRAVYKGRKGAVKVLLSYGANVNLQNKLGQTPLWDAVYWGYEGLVKLFIRYGADVNIPDKRGETPLHIARKRGFKGIERVLLERGAKE